MTVYEVVNKLIEIDASISILKTQSSDWDVIFPFRKDNETTLCYLYDGTNEEKVSLNNGTDTAMFYLWNGIDTIAVPSTSVSFFNAVGIGGRFLQQRNKFCASVIAAALRFYDKPITFILKKKTLLAVLSGTFEPISQKEEFQWILDKWGDEWVVTKNSITARKTIIQLESDTYSIYFQTSSIGKSAFICNITNKSTNETQKICLKHSKGFKNTLQTIN